MKKFLFLLVTLLIVGIGFFIHLDRVPPPEKEAVSLIKSWGKFPIYFIENRGQTDPQVNYYVKGSHQTLFFGSEGMTISIQEPKKQRGIPGISEADALMRRWNLKLNFIESNERVEPEGEGKTGATFNYFKGPREEWKTGIDTYRSIRYREVWPGVDLVYSGTTNLLKQDFIVQPGSDPDRIRLACLGAESIKIGDDGVMAVETPYGKFQDARPEAYQMVGEKKVMVDVSYDLKKMREGYEYRFRLGPYDPSRELIIDPATVIYAGFIGGSADETGYAIKVDSSGSAYVVGETNSTESTFPETVGPDLAQNGGADAFVAKVNASGSALTYAGFIGGSGTDKAYGVAVDSSGNAYVTGETNSTESTFPTSVGPDLTQNGGTDAFVAKISENGLSMTYVGFIGGSGDEIGRSIAVDSDGNAYVTGGTTSTESTFPETGGPDLTQNGGVDVFVAKVNASGSALTYAGFIGGSGDDYGRGIAVDSSGNAYLLGHTDSTESTFPETVGPDLTQNGQFDVFIAKVNSNASGLLYAGFIGGSGQEFAYFNGIVVDSSGNAYLTGETTSTESTFPETVGPDLTQNGGTDAFVAKVSADAALTYAGYIGGNATDRGSGIAIDSSGNAYVTGDTASTESTFPETGGPDLTQNGGTDAFVVKVNTDGSALTYAGFIGGSGNDFGYGIAVDSSGNAYIAGNTDSTESTFPETGGPDLTQNGGDDAFVAKVGIVVVCGDGVLEGSEVCDDGNTTDTDACTNSCKNAACGDGVVRTGVEGCDDGNSVNTDACTNACALASCGNGIVQTGEACDDGNTVETDACTNKCQTAICGDSVVRTDEETCDDGNTVETDACPNSCKSAACGDKIIQTDKEACDDGNTVDTDECTNSCKGASCGDGIVRTGGEECDDGNTTDGDDCSVSCTTTKETGGAEEETDGDDEAVVGATGGGCSLFF